MKIIRTFLAGLLVAIGITALAATFNTFSPVTGLLKGNANSPVTTLAAGTDVTAVFTGTCNSTAFLRGDGSCQTFSTAANPTGLVGTTAVNGVASTFMASDSAPAINQAMAPTWTGAHTWSAASTAITVNSNGGTNDILLTGNQNATISSRITNTNASTAAVAELRIVNNSHGSAFQILGTGNASGEQTVLNAGTGTLNFATGGVKQCTLLQSGPSVSCLGPVAAALVDMTPDASSFTITYTGFTVANTKTAIWSRNGNQACLFLPTGTGTSNTTNLTATGLPAAITPARNTDLAGPAFIADDNSALVGDLTLLVSTTNTIAFFHGAAGTWTAAGTKGLAGPVTICYNLN